MSQTDSIFNASTQLNTALGEYDSSSPKTKSTSASILTFLILLVFALMGVAGFIYVKQMEVSKLQTQFYTVGAQVQRVSAAAAQIFIENKDAWSKFDTQTKTFNAEWSNLQAQVEINSVQPAYSTFNKSLTGLLGQRQQFTDAIAAFNAGEAVDMGSIGLAQTKVVEVTDTGNKLNSALNELERMSISSVQELIQYLSIAALFIAILIFVLLFLVLRNISTDGKGRGQEMSELTSLVEELQSESKEQRLAMQEQVAAERRINEANQAAILRLMNELQNLAEGDLTQQATVTEDITGAIADSVNYTMEELRNLVSQVQSATTLVSSTTAVVEATSTELLASSDEQLREIRETGQAVLDVAARINNVSTQAQQSATVARQSMNAAEKGMQAVQNAIGGMNTIRDQIQDTSKRIKRLVESSQEIGEITDLIADITEQTNILALNAAIQAASAGEAGRGFSVVAEEVQRLAERSAGATRQIASLIKSIQADMQDAMAAMERSTRGVVEGAQLSDETGTAFTEIDSVTRKLAALIQEIAQQTQNEAVVANGVAENIQHIFAVTGQTADGTRSTAQQVRELARIAEQLERSVARFRIS